MIIIIITFINIVIIIIKFHDHDHDYTVMFIYLFIHFIYIYNMHIECTYPSSCYHFLLKPSSSTRSSHLKCLDHPCCGAFLDVLAGSVLDVLDTRG